MPGHGAYAISVLSHASIGAAFDNRRNPIETGSENAAGRRCLD